MPLKSYKETLKEFADQIVIAQQPIRILESIKVENSDIKNFIKNNYKGCPKLNAAFYSNRKLGYKVSEKKEEFKRIKAAIKKKLSKTDPVAELLTRMVDDYLLILDLLNARGTPSFGRISCKLYGSPFDTFTSDHNSIIEMSQLLDSILSRLKNTLPQPELERNLKAKEVVKQLNHRMKDCFGTLARAELSNGVIADAAAGGDRVRIRSDRMFSQRDIDMLEVHEGWVHVGTTLNGRHQRVAKWLSVGPPRCTSTQEGLAVMMEIFTFRSSVQRAQKINDRVVAIAKAIEGANFADVFEFFRTEGYSEDICLSNTIRVFRGTSLTGGYAFTKDISYCKGFVELYNFLRSSVRAGHAQLIPFLFAGKLPIEDIPLVYRLYQEGIVDPPRFLPPQFQDLNAIAVWMSFSSFFNRVDMKSVQEHFNSLFIKHSGSIR